jgi:hypothetical protein
MSSTCSGGKPPSFEPSTIDPSYYKGGYNIAEIIVNLDESAKKNSILGGIIDSNDEGPYIKRQSRRTFERQCFMDGKSLDNVEDFYGWKYSKSSSMRI